jgi:glyoxylase-like metal-dependent hydrolase (beta-lactamase superfamily II)
VQTLLADPSTAEDRRGRIRRYIENLRNFARDWRGTYLVPPTETFTDSLTIDDPVRPVRIMFLGRANTEGDAVAWLPRERIVATGDIVVSPVPFGFFSFPEPWIATLERIKALDFALLVPGHGRPMRDSAYLDRLIATISDIRAQVGPLARQGLSLEDVRSRVDFTAQTAIFAADARLRPAFEGYWLTPMVENAWREARGLAIVQGGGETTPASVNRQRSR